MGACATLPLLFNKTDLALSFTVTVRLDAGFKHKEKISPGQLLSLCHKPSTEVETTK